MGLQTVTCKINGVAPFLSHNGQTADPLNRYTKMLKEVTSKRKKTDEDHEEIARIEWHASLYVGDDQKLILPADLIDAAIIDGAKKSKLGKQFKSAVFVDGDGTFEIGHKYNAAADLWALDQFRDARGVRVGTARVIRTRPIFRNWSSVFAVNFDDTLVNENDVVRAITDAGHQCGVGDYRPKFGRFEIAN